MLPSQRAFLLGILCFGMVFSILTVRRCVPQPPPNFEFTNLTPAELYEKPGFVRHEHAPLTWTDISLRLYGDDQGQYQKILRCKIDGREVEAANPSFWHSPDRYRTRDDAPPTWWQRTGQADAEGNDPWLVPDWFQVPTAEQERDASVWNIARTGDFWLGQYLHYDEQTGYMSLWEWRRIEAQPPARPEHVVCDELAHALGKQLLAEKHQLSAGGWLISAHEPIPQDVSFAAPTVDCGILFILNEKATHCSFVASP